MVLTAVDEGDLDRSAAERPGGEEPGESAAHDHHAALATLLVHGASLIPSSLIAVPRLAGRVVPLVPAGQ